MANTETIVDRLCHASEKQYAPPVAGQNWPTSMPTDAWCTSPELISLYGTSVYEELDLRTQMRLSLLEAINFFSLNIHGEKALIAGLAQRLYRPATSELDPYLHHFLDEENKHMVYFGEFCTRYGKKIYADRKLSFPRAYAPGEEDFLFFTKVMIFEEIVDAYNKRMSLDKRLHPVVQEINMMHHKDEARHLVFGRQVVAQLFASYRDKWSHETLSAIRQYLDGYIRATWREYYNPDVYKDLELRDPFAAQIEAWRSDATVAHRKKTSASCIAFLLDMEILTEEPSLL